MDTQNKITVSDGRIIDFSVIESIGFIPMFEFAPCKLSKNVKAHQKGEKIRWCLFKKKIELEEDMFEVMDVAYRSCLLTLDDLAEFLIRNDNAIKNQLIFPFSSTENDKEARKKQILVDHERGLLIRRTTLTIRTKSGQDLFAFYDSDSEGQLIMSKFNKSFH